MHCFYIQMMLHAFCVIYFETFNDSNKKRRNIKTIFYRRMHNTHAEKTFINKNVLLFLGLSRQIHNVLECYSSENGYYLTFNP